MPSITNIDDDESKRREKNRVAVEMLAEAGRRETGLPIRDDTWEALEKLVEISPHFAQLTVDSNAIDTLPSSGSGEYLLNDEEFRLWQPVKSFFHLPGQETIFISLKDRLVSLRMQWRKFLLNIVMLDVLEEISRKDSKRKQTKLAELVIEEALSMTRTELEKRYSVEIAEFPFAVMGLGKLGGKGMDYGSDLDLILVYDDEKPIPVAGLTHAEIYGRAVEIFVNVLSGMTRGGILYRVDLRLRPYGKNGASSISKRAFLDYLGTKAAIWEWLAYVKIRGVAGDMDLARETENRARTIIHDNSRRSRKSDPEFHEFRNETRRVRLQLEKQRGAAKGREVDIKFGEGGMLDVYFLMRFLQLRDDVPDDAENRSSDFMLRKLFEAGSLSGEDHNRLAEGYAFLSDLDHDLRLTVGRSTRFSLANRGVLEKIARRMGLASRGDLIEKLTFHRLNIRAVFDKIVSP